MLKKAVQQGRSERRGEEVRPALCVAVRPLNESWRTENPLQEFRHPRGSVKYVELLSEARTLHGKGRVSARRGWAGEKSDFFRILRMAAPLFLVSPGV